VQVGENTALGPNFTVTSSIQLTDSLGNETTYSSLLAGGKWFVSNSQGSGCSSCTIRRTIQRQFDSYGDVTSYTDERGNTTSYTYDANFDLASVTQPAVGGTQPQTTYTYNSFGEVLTMTDPLGNVTKNTYDAHGNLLTVTTPAPNGNTAPSVTQFAYNSLGELTQVHRFVGTGQQANLYFGWPYCEHHRSAEQRDELRLRFARKPHERLGSPRTESTRRSRLVPPVTPLPGSIVFRKN